VSSPAVSRIKASMTQRFGELEKFFASGAVGLTKDGMVDVRDSTRSRFRTAPRSSAWSPRTTLIVRSCTRRLQRPAATRVGGRHSHGFAKGWVRTGAKPGWYYQDDGGAWKQKYLVR